MRWAEQDDAGPYNRYGNGSAMRVAAVAWALDDLEAAIAEAERTAAVTHNHPEGIEGKLHERFAASRINAVNLRREFFNVTPAQVKEHLALLTGELLQFQDLAEALEYRQCLALRKAPA